MPGNSIIVRVQTKNQKIREELEEVISSMEGFHLQKSADPGSCDLLILEIGDNLNEEFEHINSMQAAGTVKEIYLTSCRSEPDTLIQAMRAGAKEFLPQPLQKGELRDALSKFRARREALKSGRARGKIINVIGSKGGVGTTTVAVNLAVSLNDLKEVQSVALIDMNLLFGEIPIFLDLESSFNWGEVAKNISRLDSTYLMTILSKHPSGVYVLPSPPTLDGVTVATPQMIEKLLGLMQSSFDFIVIDSGQSLDDISLRILEMSDSVLLVSILSFPSLINIKKLKNTFRKFGFPARENLKIIMNRFHKNSVISRKEAEQSIDQKIFWLIPNDYTNTMSAINQGKPLPTIAQDEEITKNFRELAASFIRRGEKQKEKRRFWSKKLF